MPLSFGRPMTHAMNSADPPAPGLPGGRHFVDAVAEMREPFVVLDAAERLLAWNRAYDELHREADGAPVLRAGMSYAEMQDWRARTGFFRSVSEQPPPAAADAAHVRSRGDLTAQLRDGRWMIVERYALPDGRNIGVWTDITALMETEQQLRATAASLGRSQAQLALAQRIAQIGSDERDLASEAVTWSDETYRIFGVARDEFALTRASVLALVHPDDRAAMASAFASGRDALGPQRQEFRVVRPDGAERIIVRESEVARDGDGTPLRRIGTIQDVTEARVRERLERDLTRALETAKLELEARVDERTRQLQAAQDELLRKERLSAIGQLTAMVAHELRNPLSAIKNTLHALKEGAGPTLARPVARMERSLERCHQIIGELLDFTRVRALQCHERCLDEWLGDLLDEQHLPAEIALVRALQAGAARAAFDPDRLRRVIINLVENAAQALAEAKDRPDPTITLGTRLAGERVEIVIEDNGPGIPPENAARIFDPFFTTKSTGTGLGLPMVKQIVEQHGGDIALASTPGQGTRFSIRIPLHQRPAAAA
jgi:PAS domain S-box-containing protein